MSKSLSSLDLDGFESESFGPYGHYRLYWKDERAVAVEWVRSDGEPIWERGPLVNVLFQCIGYWDGPRHLHWGDNGDIPGYTYYPDMDALAEMLKRVSEIYPDAS